MNDGRMSSRVSVTLYGPDGEIKTDPHTEECLDETCGTCPQKEEDHG